MRKLLFAVGILAAITLTPLSALAVGGMTDIISNDGISLCDRPDTNTSCDPDKAISCGCGVGSSAATKLDGVTTQSACANACAQLASASGQTSIYAFSCFDTGSLLESRPSGPYNTGVCDSPIVAAPVEETKPIRAPIVPILNVPIPGFDQKEFSAVVKTSDGAVSVNFMAVYLNAVYKFLMIAAALCAVLMVTLAGFQWTTARGKAGEVQAAKDKIKNVLIGVTLLLCAVSISTLIDPRTSRLQPLSLTGIQPVPLENIVEYGEGTAPSGTLTGVSVWQDCMLSTFGANAEAVEQNLVDVSCAGHSVKIHKKVQAQFEKACSLLADAGYPINSLQTYNWRASANKPSVLSFHSWGVAIDLNPATNPNCPVGENCSYDIPSNVVSAFESNGFTWGGHWKSRKDYMHFSWKNDCGGAR